MNYYILPKNKNTIIFNIEFRPFVQQLYISHSLYNYISKIVKLLNNIVSFNSGELNNSEQLETIANIIHPYKFIYSNVPNTSISVSKLKPYSNTFYDFIEIVKSLNIFELYNNKKLNTLLFGENSYAIMECMDIIREDYNDNYNYINDFKNYYLIINNNDIHKKSIDFLFYDLFIDNSDKLSNKDIKLENNYNIIIKILHSIFYYQNIHGTCIIKVGDLFYKPIIDLLYILSNSYNNIYIIKPITSNVISNEKYIVCKRYNHNINDNTIELYSQYLLEFIKNDNILLNDIINNTINSTEYYLHNIIKNEIPYYFLNKIEELNIIFGNNQLDAYNSILNLMKHKNREEKVESIKKINIQKCIHWCEKNNIPYNKFIEKLNIFYNNNLDTNKK